MKKTYLTSMMLAAVITVSVTGCGNIKYTDDTHANADTSYETSSAKAVKTSEEENFSEQNMELSNNTTADYTFIENDTEQTSHTSEIQSVTTADSKTAEITEASELSV